MGKIDVKALVNVLKDGMPGVEFTILDPSTETEAEIQMKLEELRVKAEKFRETLDACFKQIHNDNIGAPIERYYEDAENYFADDIYFLGKIKQRIKQYFDER